MVVYKYLLNFPDKTNKTIIKLPVNNNVLTAGVDVYSGRPAVWVLVTPPEKFGYNMDVTFLVMPTGESLPEGEWQYINTFKTNSDSLVWHVFKGVN